MGGVRVHAARPRAAAESQTARTDWRGTHSTHYCAHWRLATAVATLADLTASRASPRRSHSGSTRWSCSRLWTRDTPRARPVDRTAQAACLLLVPRAIIALAITRPSVSGLSSRAGRVRCRESAARGLRSLAPGPPWLHPPVSRVPSRATRASGQPSLYCAQLGILPSALMCCASPRAGSARRPPSRVHGPQA